MSNFQKDDRVIVTRGEHHNKHGKVMGETRYGLLRKYPVKLDNNDNSEILEVEEGFLEYENLNSSEVSEQIKNVNNQVVQVASHLPGEMGKEVPTHLKYLEKAIASTDKESAGKELAGIEYEYVVKNLKAASQRGFVTKEWMETIRIPFEKLHWAVKRLS